MKSTLGLTIFTVIFAISSEVFGASKASDTDQQSQKIESVLDKLESKFLDRENAPLTYDETRAQAMKPAEKSVKSIEISPKQPITGKTPNQNMLKEIQAKINEYENQVDSLEADSRKMKSQVIQGSTTDNLITIEAKLKNAKTSSLQAMTAKVDGSLMFNQVDPAGMWIPSSTITIYHGPMQPGDHKIEITAVLARTNEQGIAVAGWTPQQVKQSFTVSLPEGKVRKHMIVELDTSKDQSGKAVANLMEENVEPRKTEETVE